MHRWLVVLSGVCLLAIGSWPPGGTFHAQQPPAVPPGQPAAGRGGPPVQGAEPDIPLVARFDRNGDRVLDYGERTSAREYLSAHPELRRPVRGGRINRTGVPGPRVSPGDVKVYAPSVPLYAPDALRTFFLQFERDDWEAELAAFWHTDVQVPATLVVDGRTYPNVGVSFRGNNSFTAVPDGLKRPLSLTIDFAGDRNLLGHRSLNLLNSNQDPTFLRSVLYLDVARDYIPAVRANFTRVVINGESWGIYVNQQTFSTEFVQDAFKTTGGTRWKSPNNSVGGGFSYLGDDVALYRRWYEIKGKDDLEAWRALIHVTRVLNETPPETLDTALASVMDVDEVLRFLALDITLVNNDGYWRDGSDFNVYRHPNGQFLLTPHDANEGFRTGGRGGGGAQPDPLGVLDDPNKALRHKLLAAPVLRQRYLQYVGDIADKWLDWSRLGPLVERYRSLIAAEVERDTRKLDTTDAFTSGVYGPGGDAPPSATTIKGFADLRRAAILAHPEVVKARTARASPTPRQEPIVREVQLVARFDRDGDRRLDTAERAAAREYLAANPHLQPPRRRTRLEPGSAGPTLSQADVTSDRQRPLYDPGFLRTLFLDFDLQDWEQELAAFHQTDVDVPATLVADGQRFPEVGVHFRGHNSFLAVPQGRKRGLTISPDFGNPKQRLVGHRGLHLLNAYQDPTFVRAVLFLEIARQYIPAPRANFVRVVINGESWGVYVNQQRFDTDFLQDHFRTTRGARWRALNNAPGGGLSYLGDDYPPYRQAYEIKSSDDRDDWRALVALCRTLAQTPPARLAAALEPMMDVDGVLKFLALDNALMNGDGYWEDGSDYNLYRDPKGRFHLVHYDVNESFRPIGGARGGGPGRGVELDPLAMTDDPKKALLEKLLAAPDLRRRYLGYVRDIAEKWLDWNRLEPIVKKHQALIAAEIERDTRKLYSSEEFTTGVYGAPDAPPPSTSLKGFAAARRAYLLKHTALAPPSARPSGRRPDIRIRTPSLP